MGKGRGENGHNGKIYTNDADNTMAKSKDMITKYKYLDSHFHCIRPSETYSFCGYKKIYIP